MSVFQKILVGVDLASVDQTDNSELSRGSQQAVTQGIWLAEHLGAELTFASVLEFSPETEAMLVDEDYSKAIASVNHAMTTALGSLVQRAEAAGIRATAVERQGKPWEELTRLVLSEGFDLVVVGNRNDSVLERLLFGSTASKLLRCCPSPVWVCKSSPTGEDDVLDIVVATDLSELAETAMHRMVSLGQQTPVKLHLLHVVEDPVKLRVLHSGITPEKAAELEARVRADAEKKVHEQLGMSDYRSVGHGVQVQVLPGRPESQIPNYLNQHTADVLVMGTVGRSGLGGLILGNTAEKLLPDIPCSLLAFKSPDFECPVSPSENA